MFQIYLLNFVTHMQSKKVFIECDMATGYIRVSTETMKKIPGIATDRGLVMELKNFCHKNKLETAQHLAFCQLKLPGVVAALKTRIALRLVLNAIERALLEIEERGLLGEMDANIVQKEISLKIMAAQNFPYVINACSTRSLLQNISWLDRDEQLLHEIECRGTIIKFYANDVIVTQGHSAGGLFIVLNGLVRSESQRNLDNIYSAVNDKAVYYCSSNRKLSLSGVTNASDLSPLILHGFCTRGNIIGELAFLNERPEHKTYRCATYVETFFISSLDLTEISKRSCDPEDPLTPLEKKIWRTIAIRQAARMIYSGILSSNLSSLALFRRIMDSYIVDGNITRTLTVSPDEVAAVILIQGYVSQFYSELRYVGPCILPYNQQKFLSHPELGPRVIYLIVKSKSMEDTGLESLVPEEPQMSTYEDSLTISSGASDIDPYRRDKDDIGLRDESDYPHRALASGMSESQLEEVTNYKTRLSMKGLRPASVAPIVEPKPESRISTYWT
ncbi:unnamed protein product [Candidula unifasciata]|uniref:Cyclic nucleotide-binding domain-containing protein n=1 Tax=Candidula unifasciata TaxID=100452 RepID=A0A8S3YHP2_9EUPU|nr:unnamed protein product [Candidula unifasciata]